MAQIKIYGLRAHIEPIKRRVSDTIHGALVEHLGLPPDKCFHRFFPLDEADFVHPPDRTARYTIIEISMFEGRTTETKKQLIRQLIQRLGTDLGIEPQDVEITIFETPRHNWGIRGAPGDELLLDYRVDV
jgi:4-oxalocrotonate tautomerase family enzyme